MYGADIEVFHDARLIYKGEGGSNIGATVICGEKIEIGKGTMMGRNVLIRDNNGDHYINRTGYKNTRPVVIGEKAWLCEGCTIMLGVNIGDGAIVEPKHSLLLIFHQIQWCLAILRKLLTKMFSGNTK